MIADPVCEICGVGNATDHSRDYCTPHLRDYCGDENATDPIYEIISDPIYETIAETKLDDRGDGNAVSRWLPSYCELVGFPYVVGWLYVEVLTDYEIWSRSRRLWLSCDMCQAS